MYEAAPDRLPTVATRVRSLVGLPVTRIYFSGKPATRTDYGFYRSERSKRIAGTK